jgi:hypothetical protein
VWWQAFGGQLAADQSPLSRHATVSRCYAYAMAGARKRQKKAIATTETQGRTRFTIRISERLADYLDAAVKLGLHGPANAEVARKFIENEIERLVREGMIRIKPHEV